MENTIIPPHATNTKGLSKSPQFLHRWFFDGGFTFYVDALPTGRTFESTRETVRVVEGRTFFTDQRDVYAEDSDAPALSILSGSRREGGQDVPMSKIIIHHAGQRIAWGISDKVIDILADNFGCVWWQESKVSRVDLTLQTDVPIDIVDRERAEGRFFLRTSGHKCAERRTGERLESLTFGTLRRIQTCVYDKVAELQAVESATKTIDLVQCVGDDVDSATRFEFRICRDFLRDMGANSVLDVVERRDELAGFLIRDYAGFLTQKRRDRRAAERVAWWVAFARTPSCVDSTAIPFVRRGHANADSVLEARNRFYAAFASYLLIAGIECTGSVGVNQIRREIRHVDPYAVQDVLKRREQAGYVTPHVRFFDTLENIREAAPDVASGIAAAMRSSLEGLE